MAFTVMQVTWSFRIATTNGGSPAHPQFEADAPACEEQEAFASEIGNIHRQARACEGFHDLTVKVP